MSPPLRCIGSSISASRALTSTTHFGMAPLSMHMEWRDSEPEDTRKDDMSKAYWISAYRSIQDELAVAAYAKLAAPALMAAGGRFLARGQPAQVYESGLAQRTVIIEFDSVAQAIAA